MAIGRWKRMANNVLLIHRCLDDIEDDDIEKGFEVQLNILRLRVDDLARSMKEAVDWYASSPK